MTSTTNDIPTDTTVPEPTNISAVDTAVDAGVGTTNPIRVLLVDDKVIVREGVCALLDQHQGFHVIAQAASIAEAAMLDVRPDVVVTDLVLPDARGTGVVAGLEDRFPRAAIFVLIDRARDIRLDEIITAGDSVKGFALKTATAGEFLAGLRTVAQGVPYVQQPLRDDVGRDTAPGVASPDPGRAQPGIDSLTDKEREVLYYLVLGHTNAEIASLCNVSLRTVEARRSRVLSKLGVRTRAELVRVAQTLGGTDILL
jgi:DNA-binding NarL/FixJ family response regulator